MQLDILIEQKSLIKGDARSISIGRRFISRKRTRHAQEEWDAVYAVRLARHKGYGTPTISKPCACMGRRHSIDTPLPLCVNPPAGPAVPRKLRCRFFECTMKLNISKLV